MPGRFEHSPHTHRAIATVVRPAMRGLSHRAAAVVAVPAAVWLTVSAATGTGRFAAAVFGACIAVMFTISAIVHWRAWSADAYEVLFRLDHTGIYLAIAGTATPIALVGLDGWPRAVVLSGVWTVALAGILLEWLPMATRRGVAHTLFLTLGWATIPFLPAVVMRNGWGVGMLMIAGGLVYTVGAVIVAIQRPNPFPRVFGYHEVWHVMVIVAVVLHYAMVAVLVRGGGS